MHYLFLIILCFCSYLIEAQSTFSRITSKPVHGNIFSYNESAPWRNLFPLYANDPVSQRIVRHVYEGLFKLNPETLQPEKCLVSSYTIDASATVYTFKLKKNTYFHDSSCFPEGKGRELKAEDVNYSFTQLCTNHSSNAGYEAVFKNILKGADEYYDASTELIKPVVPIKGLKVIDDYTIQLTLVKPYPFLLYNLSKSHASIFPKEAVELFKSDISVKPVGTGPFVLYSIEEDQAVYLKKNSSYHSKDNQGNRFPYIDGVRILFYKEREKEIDEFNKGNLLQLSQLTNEEKTKITCDSSKYYSIDRTNFTTHYLTFNTQHILFTNKNFRKAIAFAVDRNVLKLIHLQKVRVADHGIIPPSLPDYPVTSITGYTTNKDSATYYLTKAGFTDGKFAPDIRIMVAKESSRNFLIAYEIIQQLKNNLNLNATVEVVPMQEVFTQLQRGSGYAFLGAWQGNETPHSFLCQFFGKDLPDVNQPAFPNSSRYRNSMFDQLYEKALHAKSQEESFRLLAEAEKVMMQEAPVIPLWHDATTTLLYRNILNLTVNSMNLLDLTKVQLVR